MVYIHIQPLIFFGWKHISSFTVYFLFAWNIRFQTFGGPVPYRPVEDVAFAVARFFQLGGTFQNYYMVLQLY
jgi:hypothetical protein